MRNRIAILCATAILPLTAVASFAAANQAAADPASGEVVVTGSVDDCGTGSAPRSVQISTNLETQTDGNKGVVRAGAYSVTFQNIPRHKHVRATALVTCRDDSYTDHLTIQRPPTSGDLVQRVDLTAP
ncbi:hypothetical protein EOT10_23270 [Streptomyces antnestii]|uniref:Carboxypeptidase regulatory-like domain-containing protein n=1 Tax=Streptomyces antnestii TaxID=2494256 RepID=A0A437PJA1_9ACTN|nr:hypothetical protein [Streptomyces sp. San01]RVU22353.1 hypothetical protein EOT10_23270 [Streptomyces sp. San01]